MRKDVRENIFWKAGASFRQSCKEKSGVALLEVLAALALMALMVAFALRLYGGQHVLAEKYRKESVLVYSLLRSGQVVSHALLTAEEAVAEASGEKLVVRGRAYGSESNRDSFYIADKDKDGIDDLYRERLNVPNPLVSYIIYFSCEEIEGGFWQVTLEAEYGGERLTWRKKVREGAWLRS